MSGLELLRHEEPPLETGKIVIAVIVVSVVLGGILVSCIGWFLFKAVWQFRLKPPPEFMDCLICYCNQSKVYCMLCMPRVRRGDSSLINCGCCFYDATRQTASCCIDWNTPLRQSRLNELGEMVPVPVSSPRSRPRPRPPAKWVNCGCCYLDETTGTMLCCEQPPATSISSATPNELQAGPMSNVPLAALSSASTAQTMPVQSDNTATMAAGHRAPARWIDYGCCSVDETTGDVLCRKQPPTDADTDEWFLEIPVVLPAVPVARGPRPPPSWVNCGCCYLDGTTGNVLCCEQPPATSISSATPNEVQAGPVSDVPLAALSSAPPLSSRTGNMPIKTCKPRTVSRATSTGHAGAARKSESNAAAEVVLEIPVPSPSLALPPGWVDCGCFYVNNTTGACTCIEEPLAAAASGDDAAAGTHPHLHTTSDAAPKAST